VASCFHDLVLPGEKKEGNVLLCCTPAVNCWQYFSSTNYSKRSLGGSMRVGTTRNRLMEVI